MDWVFTNCRQNLINSTPKCDSRLVVVSHFKKMRDNYFRVHIKFELQIPGCVLIPLGLCISTVLS
jgi:hypothetical protein